MMHLTDPAAHLRHVGQDARAGDLVQAEADQVDALPAFATDRTADLGDAKLLRGHHAGSARPSPPPSRRPTMSPTFLPRRAATLRGEATEVNALKVALIMLCGFELPIDLATTSPMP